MAPTYTHIRSSHVPGRVGRFKHPLLCLYQYIWLQPVRCCSAVRGATLFGQGLLQHAYINVQSGNQLSQFPGRLDDLPPIAGFQVGGAVTGLWMGCVAVRMGAADSAG